MSLHRTTGRAKLGLALALGTAGVWATLPVALKVALEQIDAYTLTWFRFLVAFVLLGGWLSARGALGRYQTLGRRGWTLLAIAAVVVPINYTSFLLGLERTTPGNAQILIQLAPLLMAIGGIVVFRERFTRTQWLGAGVLLFGLGLFFRDQLSLALGDPAQYLGGSALIVLAAVTWAVYALCQKQLLGQITSLHVLALLFGVATVVLFPAADLSVFARIDAWHWAAIAYCALNTLLGYGAFAEALAHLEASRVSAVLAVTPLLTLSIVALAHLASPDAFAAAHVTALGVIGAGVAVSGSIITTVKRAASARGEPALQAVD